MESIALLQFGLMVLSPLSHVQHHDQEGQHPAGAHHGQARDDNGLAGKYRDLGLPRVGTLRRVGDYIQLGVGNDLRPRVGHGGDVDPQIVDKVGRQAQTEDGVGGLQGKVGRLWQLCCHRLERVKGFWSNPLNI